VQGRWCAGHLSSPVLLVLSPPTCLLFLTVALRRVCMAEQAEHKPDMDDQVLWDGHWHMLCLQCKRVRPARSKYCRVSERCVSRFDHYCPWIGNAVGERNHRDFVIFLCLETLAMAVSFITAVGRLLAVRQSLRVLMETHMVVLVFCVFDGVVLLSVFALTCSQLTQVLHFPALQTCCATTVCDALC
jgi:hypothetical protein